MSLNPESDPSASPPEAALQPGPIYKVLHRTVFEYDSPVRNSVNTLHLEPRTFPFQRTLSKVVTVLPATRLRCFHDLFENVTHHFEIPGDHRRLEIVSRIRVQNLPLELPEADQQVMLHEYRGGDIPERTWAYLQDSPLVSRSPQVWRQAIDVTSGIGPVFGQVVAIMHWIHGNFRYDTSSTNVSTRIEEAFALRRGVCQDFTHVMLGLCRSVGIPARYASGYLYNGPRDHLVGAQASHAWAEVFFPEVGWIGFDPTNETLADERYIKIAVGRDYDDVAPVKGNYHGTAHGKMSVQVEVDKVD